MFPLFNKVPDSSK
nr:unnamed protein product [Callosobruchus chinensis]